MARERDKPLSSEEAERSASSQPLDAMLDFGRQWAPVGAEAAGIVARGVQQLTQLQMEALHDIMGQQSRSAEALRGQADPVRVMETQLQTLRYAWDRGLRCWTDLSSAAGEMQSELAACGGHLLSTEGVFAAARVLRA